MTHYMARLFLPNLGRGMGTGLALAAEWLTHYYLCVASFHLQLYILLFLEKLSKKWVLLWGIIPRGGLSIKELSWQPVHSKGLQVAHSSPKKQAAVPLNARGLSDWASIEENSKVSSSP